MRCLEEWICVGTFELSIIRVAREMNNKVCCSGSMFIENNKLIKSLGHLLL
jgi:hypothetical protein